ncbi:uncharacterized protein LOC135948735 [Calliphora vicina]|uniref:uncharacterized protein LOC135948735 n=1 Tax=Calliphora vicina TaxID=7373 RepID=UPI00325BC549
MVHTLTILKEKFTAKRLAVFFGLLTTCLIVVISILAVNNAKMSAELMESKDKMEILELYIQSMFTSGSPNNSASTLTASVAASLPPLS